MKLDYVRDQELDDDDNKNAEPAAPGANNNG